MLNEVLSKFNNELDFKRNKFYELKSEYSSFNAFLDCFFPIYEQGNDNTGILNLQGTVGGEITSGRVLRALGEIKQNKNKKILLNIDSPGGDSYEMDLITASILNFKKEYQYRNKDVKISARIGSIGASAGYAIACTADDISASESSMVGSIASIMVSQADSRLTTNVIVSEGADIKKAAWENDFTNKDYVSEMQSLVDDSGSRFVDFVGRQRGIDSKTIKSWKGGIFPGKKAKQLGLIDKVVANSDIESYTERFNSVNQDRLELLNCNNNNNTITNLLNNDNIDNKLLNNDIIINVKSLDNFMNDDNSLKEFSRICEENGGLKASLSIAEKEIKTKDEAIASLQKDSEAKIASLQAQISDASNFLINEKIVPLKNKLIGNSTLGKAGVSNELIESYKNYSLNALISEARTLELENQGFAHQSLSVAQKMAGANTDAVVSTGKTSMEQAEQSVCETLDVSNEMLAFLKKNGGRK